MVWIGWAMTRMRCLGLGVGVSEAKGVWARVGSKCKFFTESWRQNPNPTLKVQRQKSQGY